MHVFVTGATGYIGGTIAARLLAAGHQVSGLVRDPAKAGALAARGVTPVAGSLDETSVLAEASRGADAVINAASSDHRAAVEACLDALAGTAKPFLHTSGSSIVADDAEHGIELHARNRVTRSVLHLEGDARHELVLAALDDADVVEAGDHLRHLERLADVTLPAASCRRHEDGHRQERGEHACG